jgi:hypothetical protein
MSRSVKKHRLSRAAARALAVAILVIAAVSACGSLGTPAENAPVSPVSASPAVSVDPAASAPTRQAAACSDGTGSLEGSYAPRMQAMLAQAAAAWVASPPTFSGNGAPAQPGLHFVLRSVTTTSWSTDYPTVDYTIPPVGDLAPQPSPTDPSFDTAVHTWAGEQSAWKQSAAQATGAAATLARDIRQFQVARNTNSAIYSCIAAADSQLGSPAGPDTRLAVISDMQNNEPVIGLHLAGAAVLVVGICPNNVSAGCPQRFAAASQFLIKNGASSVQVVSADAVTPQTFLSFWRS